MEIIWLSAARKNLNEIYNFYAESSINTAIKVYNNILEQVDILYDFPYIGQTELSLTHFGLEFRYLLVVKRRFKVIYEVENSTIYVYTIWDCRQNPETLKRNIQKIHKL